MKTPTEKKCLWAIFSFLLVLFPGSTASSDQGGVTQIYKNANTPFDDQKSVTSVIALPKETVLVRTPYQGGRFWTETRKDKIERFQCSQCHNNKPVSIAKAAEMAHGDIRLKHGSPDKPLSCYTCHNKEERDFLVTEAGTKIDMDHSYQMCGQCHFRQKKDWVGGAHGKRLSFWAGQRVVKNCASCHNPHSPRFEKRWPATYSPPYKK
jgi:formate-dependent nitrite reductase cytochrome c552 subunit